MKKIQGARYQTGLVADFHLLDPSFWMEETARPVVDLGRYLVGEPVEEINVSFANLTLTAPSGVVQVLTRDVPIGRCSLVLAAFVEGEILTAAATLLRFRLEVQGLLGATVRTILKGLSRNTGGAIGSAHEMEYTGRYWVPEGRRIQLTGELTGALSVFTGSCGIQMMEFPMGVWPGV